MQRWYTDWCSDNVYNCITMLVSTGCTNDAIRLTGGSHAAEGTIEVCYDQTWRVVASSHWTPRNSQVVCRQLGFLSEGMLVLRYRLDDGFEVSTGFRSPRKPMYRRPERAARGRLFRFPR